MGIKIQQAITQKQTGKGPRQWAKSTKVISEDADGPCTTGASKPAKTSIKGKAKR